MFRSIRQTPHKLFLMAVSLFNRWGVRRTSTGKNHSVYTYALPVLVLDRGKDTLRTNLRAGFKCPTGLGLPNAQTCLST